jgi:hypothetical protein
MATLDPLDELIPRVIPAGWAVKLREPGGIALQNLGLNLLVLLSASEEFDGKRWIHLSVSHRSRLPSWKELRDVKDLFIGKDRLAIQVLPREKDYYNFHPNVLHLWCCLDGDPVPNFKESRGGKI